MAEVEWGTIQTYSNWCYIDCLVPDGVDLTRDNSKEYRLDAAQKVEVLWPSGLTCEATLFLKKGYATVSDHGHDYEAPDDRAYISVEVNGAKLPLYLRGQEKIRLRKLDDDVRG